MKHKRPEGLVRVRSVGMEIVVTIDNSAGTTEKGDRKTYRQEQRVKIRSGAVARRMGEHMNALLGRGAPLAGLFEAACQIDFDAAKARAEPPAPELVAILDGQIL